MLPQNVAPPIFVKLMEKSSPTICGACVIFKKTPNDPLGENSPNPVTLPPGWHMQGCQIFSVQSTKTGKNIPNYHKLYQMSIKYNKRP
jgi:hypothetical protein